MPCHLLVIVIVNKKSMFNLDVACYHQLHFYIFSFVTSAVFTMFTLTEFGSNTRQQSIYDIVEGLALGLVLTDNRPRLARSPIGLPF